MFEIVLLIVAAGGIAAYARGRGGNPIVWGGLGVGGYAFLNYVLPVILIYLHRPLNSDSRMWLFMVAAAWVGIVGRYRGFLCAFPVGKFPREALRHVVLPKLQVSQSAVRRHLRSVPAALW